ncbi:MAG: hypothetical protein OEW08_00110 [Gammaproteobacteria bacterium]|nr:hypothetical protein [Gammaproteobacteria bacterium]
MGSTKVIQLATTFAAIPGVRMGVVASHVGGLGKIIGEGGDEELAETRLVQTLCGTGFAKTLSVVLATSSNSNSEAPILVCTHQGYEIPILCPACASTLSDFDEARASALGFPLGRYIFCKNCGENSGVYVEYKTQDMPTSVTDAVSLVRYWGQWVFGDSASPDNWACADCKENQNCYAPENPQALQRLAIFSFSPYVPIYKDYLPWRISEIATWLGGGALPQTNLAELTGGCTPPWPTEGMDARTTLNLKLKLLDAVVAAIQTLNEGNKKLTTTELDATRVAVAGSRYAPLYTVQLPNKIQLLGTDTNTHPQKILRRVTAKFQVTKVGTAELPEVEATLLPPPELTSPDASDLLTITLRKEDGLPADCVLKFLFSEKIKNGAWKLKSAEKIDTPLLQYFRILRVVPSFDVQVEIAVSVISTSPVALTWQSALGELWLKCLLENSQQQHRDIISIIKNSLGTTADNMSLPGMQQTLFNRPEFFRNNVFYYPKDDETLPSSQWQRAILVAVRLLSEQKDWRYAGIDSAILAQLREEIAMCLSMQQQAASVSESVDPDAELLAILQELEIDIAPLGVPVAKSVRSDSWTRNANSAVRGDRAATPPADVSLDATMVLSRDEIVRMQAHNITTPQGERSDANLDETMVMSRSEMQQQMNSVKPTKKSLPIEDAVTSLDETIVMSRGPKGR